MQPGPDLIYKCPKCGKLLKNRSLMSGNTFGANLFSDGKQVAPMLPEFPHLTKCSKCDTIFWLSDLKEIGECSPIGKTKHNAWKDAEYVQFLDIPDLLRALKQFENDRCAGGIRRYIQVKFNDRVRYGKGQLFSNENEKVIYEENCKVLIEILGTSLNETVSKAELHRNLGNFEQCMNLLKDVSADFDWLVEKFETECNNRNTLVFLLR
jgi:uncharacterized C2H2 Zn-finger protein